MALMKLWHLLYLHADCVGDPFRDIPLARRDHFSVTPLLSRSQDHKQTISQMRSILSRNFPNIRCFLSPSGSQSRKVSARTTPKSLLLRRKSEQFIVGLQLSRSQRVSGDI